MLKLVKYQFKSNFKNLMIFLVTTLVFQILFILRLNSLVSSVQMSSSSFNVGANNIRGIIDIIVVLGVVATSVTPLILFIQNCNSYEKMMKNYNLMLTPQKGINYPLANLIYWTICLVVIGLIDLIFVILIITDASGAIGCIFLVNILIGISLFLVGILLSITVCTMKIANKSIHWIFGIAFFLIIDKIYEVIINFVENKITFANVAFNTDVLSLNTSIISSGVTVSNAAVTINLMVMLVKILALALAIFATGYIIDKKLEV